MGPKSLAWVGVKAKEARLGHLTEMTQFDYFHFKFNSIANVALIQTIRGTFIAIPFTSCHPSQSK
jgi:hypothetical protein